MVALIFFFTSIVPPIQLISGNEVTKIKIIEWKYPRPSSQFLHENTEVTIKQVGYFKEQETKLIPFETIINGKEILVSYKLVLTIIDGKVCNAITDTASTQLCYFCQLTSKYFNNVDAILQKEVNENNLSYGLSTLRMWIRLLEC